MAMARKNSTRFSNGEMIFYISLLSYLTT